MSGYARAKTGVEERLARATNERRTLLAGIGRRLLETGTKSNDAAIVEALQRESESRSRLEEIERTRDRIAAIGDRVANIQKQQTALSERQKQIDAELEPQYRTIGEEAFRVFRDNPLIDQEYADIFTPLLELSEELRQLGREIEAAEAESANKAFLEKMVVRGRLIVLKNRLAIKEGQNRRLRTEAGRQIAATDFIRTIGDPALDGAAEPFLELMEESGRITGEIAALEDERAALVDELATLGVERRPETRLAELARAADSARLENENALVTVAEAHRAGAGDTQETGLADEMETLSKLEATIAADRQLVHRLAKAMEVDKVRSEIDQIEAQIARKKQQLENINADIGSLEGRRDGLVATETELKGERGDLDELLDSANY
jgi:chromosome segregation ATPase